MGKPRRYKATKSTIEVKKDQLKKEVQIKDEVYWTQEEMDKLLNLYFHNAAWKTMSTELRRSEKSIKSKIWKICTDYHKLRYKPGDSRMSRDGSQWNERETEQLKLMQESNMTETHMSRVLMRSENAIRDRLLLVEGADRATLFDLSGQKPVPRKVTVEANADGTFTAVTEVERGDMVQCTTENGQLTEMPVSTHEPEAEFALEDLVSKVGGDYTFDGVVVSVFRKLSGVIRYVVEDDRGVLHIFSAKNLKLRTK